jgi:hypothetical protein
MHGHVTEWVCQTASRDKRELFRRLEGAKKAVYHRLQIPLVGGPGLEPGTSPLSAGCSNQLSYPPTRV